MIYWLLYLIAAYIGLVAFPDLTESDEGMLACSIYGVILTTIVMIFIRWKKTPFIYQLTFACAVGFFAPLIGGRFFVWLNDVFGI
ncbi:MAG: hypothetical protein LV481_06930 [Methylacidiphilales bacterium]|nr:hypothetical protein [Candidatus Methylacidiphilales bacterium]